MKKNIVLGIIASAALATTVLVGPSAQAGEMSGGAVRIAQREAGPKMRPGAPPNVGRGYVGPRGVARVGPRHGYYRPGWGPRYYGPRRGFYGPRYYDNGAGVALGILGGLAVGSAIANAPSRGYYDCYIEPRRVWVEGWGWRVREVEVCP